MAPLPASNTKRYFLDYSVAGEEHTLVMRVGDATTDSLAAAAYEAFLNAFGTSILTLTVSGMRVAANGSNITLPAVYGETTTFGTGTGTTADTANYYGFVGRSTAGRRARISLFGAAINRLNGDYRAEAGASTNLDAVVDWLQSNPSYFRAIDGLGVNWKDYTNLGINAYWRNEIR